MENNVEDFKEKTLSSPLPGPYMAGKCITFGQNMRILRRERGMSTETLAKFLGISTTYVGLIERGERCPSLETFLRICEFFGSSVDFMLAPAPPPKEGVRVSEKRASKRVIPPNENEDKLKTINGMARTFDSKELDLITNMLKLLKTHAKTELANDLTTY